MMTRHGQTEGLATLSVVAVALTACGGAPTQPATVPGDSSDVNPSVIDTVVASVEVTPAHDTLTLIGSTVRLTAVTRNSAGTELPGKPISWYSGRPDIATVDSAGTVSAVKFGIARINARSERVAGSADVFVNVVPASLDITPNSMSLLKTWERRAVATLYDSAGNTFTRPGIVWSSLDSGVVTVAGTGLDSATISARDAGTSAIVATLGSVADTVAIAVELRRYVSLSSLCGVTTLGPSECWGSNFFGSLGIGSFGDAALVPVPVVTPLQFATINRSSTVNCALTASGAAYCWGLNIFGQLGIGTTIGPESCAGGNACSMTPIAVSGGHTFAASPGSLSTWACGPTQNAEVVCWGSNDFGQLGNGGTGSTTTPRSVSGGLAFTAVSGGGNHACALTVNGEAYCWGRNEYGQLGVGTAMGPTACDTVPCSTTPVPVVGGLRFVSIVAARWASCGLTSDGAAYCWGRSDKGLLGIGSLVGPEVCAMIGCSTTPVRVTGSLTFTELTAGPRHVCGLTPAGTAYCWGANSRTAGGGENYGRLGVDTTGMEMCGPNSHCANTPVPVSGGFTFTALAAGSEHTCALAPDGMAICWGKNSNGELADGTQNDRFMPAPVAGSQ